MTWIKELPARLAYLRGYHRGRATGYRRGIEAAAQAVVERGQARQGNLDLLGYSTDELLEAIKKL